MTNPMPQPLKDFIESVSTEYRKKFSLCIGSTSARCECKKELVFLSKNLTQAYELGKQETLDMVMREIEQAIGNLQYPDGADYVAKDALSTLKQKLSTNIK